MATTNVLCVFEDVGIPTIGHLEVWISEPVDNGTGQTAPPFYSELKLSPSLGAQIIYDVPQRPSGESWYVVVMIYPVRQDCKKTGAQQFRFYIPEGAPAEVTLTEAIVNWPGWAPAPLRVNEAYNPSFTSLVNIVNGSTNSTLIESSGGYIGDSYGRTINTGTTGNRFAGQELVLPSSGYSRVRASIALRGFQGNPFLRMRLGWRDSPTTGTITYGDLTTGVRADEWTTYNVEADIPETTRYIRVLAYGTSTAEGTAGILNSEWGMDALMVQVTRPHEAPKSLEYFDGDTQDTGNVRYRWAGIPNNSRSFELEGW